MDVDATVFKYYVVCVICKDPPRVDSKLVFLLPPLKLWVCFSLYDACMSEINSREQCDYVGLMQ